MERRLLANSTNEPAILIPSSSRDEPPEREGTVAGDDPTSKQRELCLENLQPVLVQHGRTVEDVLQVALYLADMDAYEQVNETYEQSFEETRPARTTAGVCDLLDGVSVTLDAIVAIE